MINIDDRVSLSVNNGVADVRLNRPDKHNALDGRMFEAIVEAANQVSQIPDVRAVVLSGEGPSFCAGLDLDHFAPRMQAGDFDGIEARTHGDSNLFQYVSLAWRELPVPVIAALHGVCFGGGMQIALGADIRLVAPDAKLSVMETKWALVPDMGAMVTTRGLIRADVWRELVYTAKVLDGAEASAAGLATRVSETPREEALALARSLAERSPLAMRAAKRLMQAEGSDRDILIREAVEQTALMKGPDVIEAFRARFEKRAPRFQ
jgi:enoyl-CoA hydratase/carnithine racemase